MKRSLGATAVFAALMLGGCGVSVPNEAAFRGVDYKRYPGNEATVQFHKVMTGVNTGLSSVEVPVSKVTVVLLRSELNNYTTVNLGRVWEQNTPSGYFMYHSADKAEVQVRSEEDLKTWQTWIDKIRLRDERSVEPSRVIPN